MASLHSPINFNQIAAELSDNDEIMDMCHLLDLRHIPPFSGMKPGAEKFPGSIILRRCTTGRTLFRQGDPGQTAFLILTNIEALGILRAFRDGAMMRQQISPLRPTLDLVQGTNAGRHHTASPGFSPPNHDNPGLQALAAEIAQLEATLAEDSAGRNDAPRQVAEARLLTTPETPQQKKGLLHRLVSSIFRRSAQVDVHSTQKNIPNDGPEDLDFKTLSAPLCEGDIFGEMSCQYFAPRSSTVVFTQGTVDSPVYVMEIMRHVLEALRRDSVFRKRLEDTYRQRTMESQIRSLSMFRMLTDDDYAWLAPQLELVSIPEGGILHDEHDSELSCCYLIRNGVVRVMQNVGCLLTVEELLAPSTILRSIAEWKSGSGLLGQIFDELPENVQTLALSLVNVDFSPEVEQVEQLRRGLNTWIRTSRLAETYDPSGNSDLSLRGRPELQLRFAELPLKKAAWGPLEFRIFNRSILETLCSGSLGPRVRISSRKRTVHYASRGELIGELPVLHGQDSDTTSIALSHDPQQSLRTLATRKVLQQVDVVKIPEHALRELSRRSEKFRQYVRRTSPGPPKAQPSSAGHSLQPVAASDTADYQSMGLAWGQSLMVIDLDRCTRCNECVRACSDSHTDGHTRLHLDGPRFENRYLIPTTCRGCLDPVCMIGCPVGAIHRGERGEVWISDHCIGCSRCADQCPYGSIQMDLLHPDDSGVSVLDPHSGTHGMPPVVHEKAVVCDQCRFTPSGKPACLYACPHDAAIRVDGQAFFGSSADPVVRNPAPFEPCTRS